MRNRYVTSLLTLGAVAVFLLGIAPAAEAELICKKIRPSGPKVCYEADTGSVDSTIIAKGVSAQLAKYCDGLPSDEDCHIVIEFAIFGDNGDPEDAYCRTFVDANALPGGTLLFDDTTYSEPCWLEGQAVCYNPDDKYNRNGTSFNLPGPLTNTAEIITCSKGGTCITESTLGLFDGNGGVCNNNWTLDFTPYSFYGQVAFCPGGFDSEDVCCASDKRVGNDPATQTCYEEYQGGEPSHGQPGFLWTYCDLPAHCYNADHTIADACLDSDGLLKENIVFDCSECDLPSYCVDSKDPAYDPDECFAVDGSILPDIELQCP